MMTGGDLGPGQCSAPHREPAARACRPTSPPQPGGRGRATSAGSRASSGGNRRPGPQPTSVYYACVSKRTGLLIVVGKNSRCGRFSSKITWNAMVPPGPVRPARSNWPPGPGGPQGPAGTGGALTDYAALTETVSVPAASTNYGVVLYCPKNTTNGGDPGSAGRRMSGN